MPAALITSGLPAAVGLATTLLQAVGRSLADAKGESVASSARKGGGESTASSGSQANKDPFAAYLAAATGAVAHVAPIHVLNPVHGSENSVKSAAPTAPRSIQQALIGREQQVSANTRTRSQLAAKQGLVRPGQAATPPLATQAAKPEAAAVQPGEGKSSRIAPTLPEATTVKREAPPALEASGVASAPREPNNKSSEVASAPRIQPVESPALEARTQAYAPASGTVTQPHAPQPAASGVAPESKAQAVPMPAPEALTQAHSPTEASQPLAAAPAAAAPAAAAPAPAAPVPVALAKAEAGDFLPLLLENTGAPIEARAKNVSERPSSPSVEVRATSVNERIAPPLPDGRGSEQSASASERITPPLPDGRGSALKLAPLPTLPAHAEASTPSHRDAPSPSPSLAPLAATPVATLTAAPATLAPAAPVARPATPASVAQQVVSTIVSQANGINRNGSVVFHLRLEPPQLGPVQIHLTATDHRVSAHVIVAQEATRQLLQSQTNDLRQSLAQAGVALGGFDVTRDGIGGGTSDEGRGARGEGRATRTRLRPLSRPSPLAPRPSAPGGIDLLA